VQEQLRFKAGDKIVIDRCGRTPHTYTGKVHKELAEALYDVKIVTCSCKKCVGKILPFYAWEILPE